MLHSETVGDSLADSAPAQEAKSIASESRQGPWPNPAPSKTAPSLVRCATCLSRGDDLKKSKDFVL